MIRHTVVFRLKHAAGSAGETKFFEDGAELFKLPMIKNFERLKQVSKKTDFAYGFSMEFDDQSAYDTYNNHPVHRAYVRNVWVPNVEAFMEIDYVKF